MGTSGEMALKPLNTFFRVWEKHASVIGPVCKNDINIIKLKAFEACLSAFNNAKQAEWAAFGEGTGKTHCLRDKPPSLGPNLIPQNNFVVTIRSVRLKPSSLRTRPLNPPSASAANSKAPKNQINQHFLLRLSSRILFRGIKHVDAILECRSDDIL
jgi:hypothetical protein